MTRIARGRWGESISLGSFALTLVVLTLTSLTVVTTVFTAPAMAQDEETPSAQPSDSAAADEGDSEASGPRLAERDYGRFETLFGTTFSPNGDWLCYSVRRVDGTYELRLHDRRGDDEPMVLECGSRATFSDDGTWFAYSIGVSPEEEEKLEKAKKPVRNKLGLIDLSSGEKSEIDEIASFDFSANGRAIVMRAYGKPGEEGGNDIVVRDLATGADLHFGQVTEDRWSDVGSWLAMCVEVPGGKGNAVRLYEVDSGVLRVLDSSDRNYRGLTWREDALDLAVFREHEHEKEEDASHDILAWRGVDDRGATQRRFAHLEREAFPGDYFVAREQSLEWGADGTSIFFGIREWKNKPANLEKKDDDEGDAEDEAEKPEPDEESSDEPSPPADDAEGAADDEKSDADAQEDGDAKGKAAKEKGKEKQEKERKSLRESLTEAPGVEVWHPEDIEIMPLQKRRARFERNRTYLAAWCLGCDGFQQLGSDFIEDVSPQDEGLFVVGTDNTPYEHLRMFGPTLVDIYAINHDTGERVLIEERNKYRYGSSPGGRYYLYFQDRAFWVYDTWTATKRNLTGPIEESFVNDEVSTLTDEKPPYGVAGWAADDSFVVIYDEFDLWRFEADGSAARRLTSGYEDEVRHRYARVGEREEWDFAPERPVYLSLFGERTKKSGYARLSWESGEVERLLYDDARFGGLERAERAPVFVYRRESFSDSPDFFVVGESFDEPTQISNSNPFQEEYFTGRSELIDFVSDRGEPLQGALYYPTDYVPGERYPMIVYIYEELSQNIHRYVVPSERDPYNARVFTSQGYFVLMPDIVYRPQNPGLSAVECVEPAVRKVIETGQIDPDRVGLVGHSWGAYQTSFIVTQSKLFAAGVAGAPLTNMISMSTGVYWNSGQTNAWIFHESQGRMDQPFWRDVDTYIDNSPIFHLDDLRAPLLIAFGTEDGAVDWHQGVEMYNAARMAGKPVVMVVYEGENHGLRQKPNQVDYHYRVREWFDHHLKGKEAPSWIVEGESFLEREDLNEAIEKKNGKPKRPGRVRP